MRELADLLGVLLVVACSSDPGPTRHSLAAGGGGAGQSSGGASEAGANSTAGAGANSTGGAGGKGATCPIGTLPAGAPKVNFEISGQAWEQPGAPLGDTLDAAVLVERVSIGDSSIGNQSIYLVGGDGQRYVISVDSPSVDPTKLARGSKLWLTAFERIAAANPFAVPHRLMQFTLRTEQNGPILLAGLQGFKPDDDSLLGLPLSTASWCSAVTPSGNKSYTTGEPCSVTVERFAVTINASSSPVEISPGSSVTVTLGTQVYDASLRDAETAYFSDFGCAPEDWEQQVSLWLDVAPRNWDDLVSNISVAENELPACVVGSDAPPFAVRMDWLDESNVTARAVESAMTPTAGAGGAVEFDLPSLGKLLIAGLSVEGQAVLSQGRWLSSDTVGQDLNNFVIRDGQGGKLLAAVFGGYSTDVFASVASAERLGVSITLEPRCEWMSVDCGGSSALRTLYAYDVVYGDTTDHRVSSHTRTRVAAIGGQFDAWLGIAPNCFAAPSVHAVFLAAP